MHKKTAYIAQAGMIAATYTALSLIVLISMQGFAWGPVQFRISEAMCVLATLTPAAVVGLTLGCMLTNLVALTINGVGALGVLDVIFGSLATFLGAWWAWKMREHTKVALCGPVVANALIVPAYLPVLLQGLGYYTLPFTTISLDGIYGAMYLFGVVSVGVGEATVVYGLGLFLLSALRRFYVKGKPTSKR